MRLVLLALATLCFSAPAVSQDGSEGSVQRTPESAQTFLGEFFRNDNTAASIALMRNPDGALLDYVTALRRDGSAVFNVSGEVQDWVGTDRCLSVVQVREMRSLTEGQEFYHQPLASWSYALDWSKVVEFVRHEHGAISFKTTSGRGNSPYYYRINSGPRTEVGSDKTVLSVAIKDRAGPTFFFKTPQEADRVLFAFSFLKDACALQSDTGF